QLRASYVEFLFPRLETGLLHANITEKMCNTWMSLIIRTFCERSGMASGHSINNMAFCVLCGIPDLWLRSHTARATELVCSLNSTYSAAGSSTMARFCAFTNSPNAAAEAKNLEKRKKFPRTNGVRMGPTLKYLKDVGIRIISPERKTSAEVSSVVDDIKYSLERSRINKVIVFTDGSTSPMNKFPNSGCGIFITDEKNIPVWSGGMVVRTDGNNFIAELAAAAITVKAVPTNLPLLLRIDSMAAIGAITKGPVSERKRIRAAGRAWLNFSRSEFFAKMKTINVEHVSSHTGTQTPEQIGNDTADRLANKFRLKGESSQPAPYFWETEEALLFQHGNVSVQGDPRSYLKRLEQDQMIKIWKQKAPKQAKWFTASNPSLTTGQTGMEVVVESGKGKAWLYFVFAICQWLPTN